MDGLDLNIYKVLLLPWLGQCLRVVGGSREALVLQAFRHQRRRDKLTAVIIILLLTQRLSIRERGGVLIRQSWQLGALA